MSLSLLAGATSGLAAAGLVLLGVLILVPIALRLAFVIRRPGHARIAKGFASGALVLIACGIGLFLASDLTENHPGFRHALDAATPILAGLTLLLAVAVGVRQAIRTGRRAPRREATPEPGAAAGSGTEPPP